MNFTKIIILILATMAISLLIRQPTKAEGFSISPSTVLLENIMPGQTHSIILKTTRYNTQDYSTLEIKTENNFIKSWINPKDGYTYQFKPNQKYLEIPLNIQIPPDTKTGTYKTKIFVNLIDSPTKKTETFNIGTNLGHTINLTINITDKEFKKTKINWVSFLEGYTPKSFVFFNLPGSLSLVLDISNTGNTRSGIKKIQLDIYKTYTQQKVTSIEHKKDYLLKPFSQKKLFINILSYLPTGKYRAEILFFDDTQYKPYYKKIVYLQLEDKNIPIIIGLKNYFSTYSKEVLTGLFIILLLITGLTYKLS
ncbi:MAG: hypothetical protein ABIJ23_04060 [Candidatus Magasanikbacteria bacterium]